MLLVIDSPRRQFGEEALPEQGIAFHGYDICDHISDNVIPHLQFPENEPIARVFGPVCHDITSGADKVAVLIELLGLDHARHVLDAQLPERAAFIFNYDPKAALAASDNAEVLSSPKTTAVIDAFSKRVPKDAPLTAERFKAIVNEVKLRPTVPRPETGTTTPP